MFSYLCTNLSGYADKLRVWCKGCQIFHSFNQRGSCDSALITVVFWEVSVQGLTRKNKFRVQGHKSQGTNHREMLSNLLTKWWKWSNGPRVLDRPERAGFKYHTDLGWFLNSVNIWAGDRQCQLSPETCFRDIDSGVGQFTSRTVKSKCTHGLKD